MITSFTKATKCECMNGVGVYIMDDYADDPGSVPAHNNIYFLYIFPFRFFVSFFLFLWGRSHYVISFDN